MSSKPPLHAAHGPLAGPALSLPVSIAIEGKCCLLVGGCNQALLKARLLTKAGAILHVFAYAGVEQELLELTSHSGGTLNLFDPHVDLLDAVRKSQWLDSGILCVVALQDNSVATKIAALVLLCCVISPTNCRFRACSAI